MKFFLKTEFLTFSSAKKKKNRNSKKKGLNGYFPNKREERFNSAIFEMSSSSNELYTGVQAETSSLVGNRVALNRKARNLATAGRLVTDFVARALYALGMAAGMAKASIDADKAAGRAPTVVIEQASVKVTFTTKKPKNAPAGWVASKREQVFSLTDIRQVLDAALSSFSQLRSVYSASHKRKENPSQNTVEGQLKKRSGALVMPFVNNSVIELLRYIRLYGPNAPQQLASQMENLRQQIVATGRVSNTLFGQILHRAIAAGTYQKYNDNGVYYFKPDQQFNAIFQQFYQLADKSLLDKAQAAYRKDPSVRMPQAGQFTVDRIPLQYIYHLYIASIIAQVPVVTNQDGSRKLGIDVAFGPNASLQNPQIQATLNTVYDLAQRFSSLNTELAKYQA